jgi:hypothetical protein
VRVFRHDPAQIVPHAGYDLFPPLRREFRHGAFQVAPGLPRRAEARADGAADPAAKRGRGIQREHHEDAVDHVQECRFQRIAEVTAASPGELASIGHLVYWRAYWALGKLDVM